MDRVTSHDVPDPAARARDAMAEISRHALSSNLRRVAELGDALAATRRHELADPERSGAVDVAHQLVGSAGTFGYERVSHSARQLERFFGDVEHEPETVEAAAAAIALIEQDLRNGPDDDD